jgi:uncharacterized membrane protein
MKYLSNIGRIFYGIAIVGTGILTIYYKSFPYWLLPPQFLTPAHALLAYISGALLVLAGAAIVFKKEIMPISFLLGCALLLIFCFLFLPYDLMPNSNYLHLALWENAAKELAIAGGAFVIAGCFSAINKNPLNRFWGKLVPLGAILFSIPIINFGILHFLYGKEVSSLVPSWIPYPVFWIYFAGVALLGSGIAIIFKIKPGLIASLLGIMVFIWFVILHIPRVIVAPADYLGGEVASAFLALAYSGIAFVIAGTTKKTA